jgi:glycosyltransferase involved in cell wall biosynthesis
MMTRDRPEFLRLALDSVAAQDIPCDVLVIDQASSPGAAAAVAAECDWRSDVRLHRSELNHGIAGGRNVGVGLSRAELVLFLDDDAELMPGALAYMIDLLDGDPGAAAVSATVVTPDGLVSHSGGSLECRNGVASFALTGCGEPFAEAELAPTGPAGWLGGTALLARRTLLEEFPFDDGMHTNFDDNEWCYRISLARPGCLRRSREALVLHHLAGRQAGVPQPVDAGRLVSLLTACAHFYGRHGLLLGPWSWELLPDRVAADGDLGLGDVRLLMELITAKGQEWTLAAWNAGELENLLLANKRREQVERTHPELEVLRPEVPRLNQIVSEQQQAMAWLVERDATLRRIEAGGWWRLRGRLGSLLRPAQRLLGWLRAPSG